MLQTLVARLQRFQQASDVLRRTSRFVILARRLQVQMNEVQGIKSSDKSPSEELATATVVHGKDIENEKERAIAKAALSIAELGAFGEIIVEIQLEFCMQEACSTPLKTKMKMGRQCLRRTVPLYLFIPSGWWNRTNRSSTMREGLSRRRWRIWSSVALLHWYAVKSLHESSFQPSLFL